MIVLLISTMKEKFISDNRVLSDFYKNVMIHCPVCNKLAIIKEINKLHVLTCIHCSYQQKGENLIYQFFPRLWLKINCYGNELWALNREHLYYIKKYVSAKIRERRIDNPRDYKNKRLDSRLPNWIKSAKNRQQILKCIDKLEKKLYQI